MVLVCISKRNKLNFEIELDRHNALVVAGPGWEKLEQMVGLTELSSPAQLRHGPE